MECICVSNGTWSSKTQVALHPDCPIHGIKTTDSHIALIRKLDEYIEFLGKANAGPISNAFVHGWRCPQEDIDTGERLRKEIAELRKA